MSARKPRPLDIDLGLPDIAPTNSESAKVPALFTDFCAWIGVSLTLGQRVATRVAYDGVEPRDLPPDERAMARILFGDIDVIAKRARRVLVAVCGARAGKTYVLEAMRLLHLALTVPIGGLAPGEVASGPIIAPDMKLAKQPLRYIQGAIASKPELAAMVFGEAHASESIELARDGRLVEIVVRSASGQGRTGRGFSLFGALLDETAMLRDEESVASDIEIFRALRPRLTLPGAQLVVASTPWAQAGLLHALFAANHPNPSCAGLGDAPKNEGTALAMHAATLVLHDTGDLREVVETERAFDPDNAAREYDAQFMAAGISTFFDPLMLARCIDDDMVIPRLPEAGDQVTSGGDLGFTKNSSALVITHRRSVSVEEKNERTGVVRKVNRSLIAVAEVIEKRPEEGVSLKPSEVMREFAARIVAHHGSYLVADGHYRETAVEHLAAVGLGFLDAPIRPADAFIATRAAMREDRVRIPNHPRLIRQLRETTVRYGTAGTIQVILPRWKTGEHGDIAAAYVLAVSQAAGETVPAPRPEEGTPEAFAAQAKAITSRRRDAIRKRTEGDGSFGGKWPGR